MNGFMRTEIWRGMMFPVSSLCNATVRRTKCIFMREISRLCRLSHANTQLVDVAGVGRFEHQRLAWPFWGKWGFSSDPPQSGNMDALVIVDHFKPLAWANGFKVETDL